jgi:hypothetical protein
MMAMMAVMAMMGVAFHTQKPGVLRSACVNSKVQSQLQNLPQRGAKYARGLEIRPFLVPSGLFRGLSRLLQLPLQAQHNVLNWYESGLPPGNGASHPTDYRQKRKPRHLGCAGVKESGLNGNGA